MGIVLADGEPVALWRGRKKGKKLEVAVEALAQSAAETRDRDPARAARAAPRLHVGRGVVSLTGRYARPDAARRHHRLRQRQRQDDARESARGPARRPLRRARRARPRPGLDRDARRRAARDARADPARRRLGDRRRLRAQARHAGARRRRHDRLARPADARLAAAADPPLQPPGALARGALERQPRDVARPVLGPRVADRLRAHPAAAPPPRMARAAREPPRRPSRSPDEVRRWIAN